MKATEAADASGPADDQRAARLTILTVARRVLQQGGLAALTIDHVAAEAGMPPEAVSSYFKNPQDLLLSLATGDLPTMTPESAAEDHASGAAAMAKPVATEKSPAPPRESVHLKKRGAMTPELDQVMKEVAPQATGGQGAGTSLAKLDRRINMLEKAFADIVERHENSIRDRMDAVASVEEGLVGLGQRLDEGERRQAASAAEFQKMLMELHVRVNGLEVGAPAAAPLAPKATLAEMRLPPRSVPDVPLLELTEAERMPDSAETMSEILHGTGRPAEVAETIPSGAQSYLSAARRAANQALAESEASAPPRVERPERRSSSRRGRLLLFGCLAPAAVFAAAVFVLNRHSVTAETMQATVLPLPPPPPQVLTLPPANPTPEQTSLSGPLDRLLESANAGDAGAQRDVGLKYLAGDGVAADEAEAARWLLRAAYQGEPAAEYWLGTLYARGHGVPADAFQANHWYEAAAKQGDARAMHSLAVANYQGWGGEKNIEAAARWFGEAADHGFVDSEFNLAVMYERGSGVPESLVQAYKWYAIAAQHGDREAQARVAALANRLSAAELAQARQAVQEFKPKPAIGNDNLAGSQLSGG